MQPVRLEKALAGAIYAEFTEDSAMPHLFDAFRLRDITFHNRIGVSPM